MEGTGAIRRYQGLTTAVVALLLGVLSGSTLIVAASILIIFMAPVLLFPFLVWAAWAAWMGRKVYLPAISQIKALVLLVLLGPACALAPPALAGLELRARAGGIPVPEDFEVMKIVPDPYGNSTSGPSIVLQLAHKGQEETLFSDIAAYAEKLASGGWRHVIGSVPQARGFKLSLMFTDKHHSNLFFTAGWNRTTHAYDSITIRRSAFVATPMVLAGLLLLLLLAPVLLPARGQKEHKNGTIP